MGHKVRAMASGGKAPEDYEIVISHLSDEDGGGFVATVTELPGCMSDGETQEEALANVKDAIKAWLETAGLSMNWQPIETAPKDGTRVDLWVAGYSSVPQRIIDAWFDSTSGHWWYPSDDDVWPVDDNRYGRSAHVTHWRPLPEPPQ